MNLHKPYPCNETHTHTLKPLLAYWVQTARFFGGGLQEVEEVLPCARHTWLPSSPTTDQSYAIQ